VPVPNATPNPAPFPPDHPPRGMVAEVIAYVRRLGPAAWLAVGSATMPLLGSFVLFYFINQLGDFLKADRTTGLVMYVVGFALFSGLAVLPTYASAVLGGWAFGFAFGLPAALLGFAGGAFIGYGVSRWASKDRVKAIIDEHPKWLAVRDALIGQGFWRATLIVFLVRLPSSPFAATNLVLASLKVRFAPFMLGTVVGMMPRTSVTVFLASQIQGALDKDAAEKATPWWLLAVTVVVSVSVLMLFGIIGKRALAHVTGPDTRASIQPPIVGKSAA